MNLNEYEGVDEGYLYWVQDEQGSGEFLPPKASGKNCSNVKLQTHVPVQSYKQYASTSPNSTVTTRSSRPSSAHAKLHSVTQAASEISPGSSASHRPGAGLANLMMNTSRTYHDSLRRHPRHSGLRKLPTSLRRHLAGSYITLRREDHGFSGVVGPTGLVNLAPVVHPVHSSSQRSSLDNLQLVFLEYGQTDTESENLCNLLKEKTYQDQKTMLKGQLSPPQLPPQLSPPQLPPKLRTSLQFDPAFRPCPDKKASAKVIPIRRSVGEPKHGPYIDMSRHNSVDDSDYEVPAPAQPVPCSRRCLPPPPLPTSPPPSPPPYPAPPPPLSASKAVPPHLALACVNEAPLRYGSVAQCLVVEDSSPHTTSPYIDMASHYGHDTHSNGSHKCHSLSVAQGFSSLPLLPHTYDCVKQLSNSLPESPYLDMRGSSRLFNQSGEETDGQSADQSAYDRDPLESLTSDSHSSKPTSSSCQDTDTVFPGAQPHVNIFEDLMLCPPVVDKRSLNVQRTLSMSDSSAHRRGSSGSVGDVVKSPKGFFARFKRRSSYSKDAVCKAGSPDYTDGVNTMPKSSRKSSVEPLYAQIPENGLLLGKQKTTRQGSDLAESFDSGYPENSRSKLDNLTDEQRMSAGHTSGVCTPPAPSKPLPPPPLPPRPVPGADIAPPVPPKTYKLPRCRALGLASCTEPEYVDIDDEAFHQSVAATPPPPMSCDKDASDAATGESGGYYNIRGDGGKKKAAPTGYRRNVLEEQYIGAIRMNNHHGSNTLVDQPRSSVGSSLLDQPSTSGGSSCSITPSPSPQPSVNSVFTFDTRSFSNAASRLSSEADSPARSPLLSGSSPGFCDQDHVYMNLSYSRRGSPRCASPLILDSNGSRYSAADYANISLNYAELDHSSSKRSSSSSARVVSKRPTKAEEPIEYASIDMVATKAAAKASREHAEQRDRHGAELCNGMKSRSTSMTVRTASPSSATKKRMGRSHSTSTKPTLE